MNWFVYMIRCSDLSLYTGISNNVERRLSRHLDGRGAKYFRARKPEQLIYLESGHDRSSAGKRESAIKKMPRIQKWRLIDSPLNELASDQARRIKPADSRD